MSNELEKARERIAVLERALQHAVRQDYRSLTGPELLACEMALLARYDAERKQP